MTTTNTYSDTKAVDYLEAIKRNQLESRNSKSSSSNFSMTYMLPMLSSVGVVTTFTNTQKTLGDYEIIDNTSKLIAYLPMDLDTLDASNSNHGTVTGTETYVDFSLETGNKRKALSFNGSTNYVTIANKSNFDFEYTDSFSVSFWVKMLSIGSDQGLVVKSNDLTTGVGWKIYFQNTSDFIVFKLADGTSAFSVTSTSSLTTTVWKHIVCTFSGNSNQSGMKIYVDGTLEATGTSSAISSTILNSVSVVLGAESDAGSKFTGYMDDLQIWSFELDSTNVTDLYHGKQILFQYGYGDITTEGSDEITTEDSIIIETERGLLNPAIIGLSDLT